MSAPRRGAAVAAAAAVLAWMTLTVRQSCRFRWYFHAERVRVSDAERARAAMLPGLREVEFVAGDGVQLRGWFSPGPRGDAIVFVHGHGGNRASLLDEALMVSGRGHGVLLYDSRACGESGGEVATWGDAEQLDLRGAVDWLTSAARAQRVGAFGFSVGGTTVALEAQADPRIRAVALGPTWTSFSAEIDYKSGKLAALTALPMLARFALLGVHPGRLRPIDAVAQLAPRPLLFLGGDADADTPLEVTRRLQAAAPGSRLVVVHGAHHTDEATVDPALVEKTLGDFFDAALDPRATALSHP